KDRGQETEPRGRDLHDLDRPDHQEDFGHALAEPDQAVGDQELPESRRQSFLPSGGGPYRGSFRRGRAQPPRERQEHRGREHDRHGESRSHAIADSPLLEEQAAQGRGENDRDALQNRLHGEADDPPASLELLPDQRESRGETERLPAHYEQEAEKHGQNGRKGEIEDETRGRKAAEE